MLNKLKLKRSFFRKSEFSNNVLTLMTGTTIAQAIYISEKDEKLRLVDGRKGGYWEVLDG